MQISNSGLVVTANSSARTVKALNPSKSGGGTLGTTNSFGRSSPYPSTLLAVGPFFLFLGPLGLCPIPFLRCPFRDIVDLGRRRRCLRERYSRRDHANNCCGDERGSNK